MLQLLHVFLNFRVILAIPRVEKHQDDKNRDPHPQWSHLPLCFPLIPYPLEYTCQGGEDRFLGTPKPPLPGPTGLLRSADRMCFPSTCSLNRRRASSNVALCPAFPSFPKTRPLRRASRWPRREQEWKNWDYLGDKTQH